MPAEIRRWSESLKLELGMVVSHHVGSGASARGAIALNHWAFLQARNINLTIYVYEFLPEYTCTVMHPEWGIQFHEMVVNRQMEIKPGSSVRKLLSYLSNSKK